MRVQAIDVDTDEAEYCSKCIKRNRIDITVVLGELQINRASKYCAINRVHIMYCTFTISNTVVNGGAIRTAVHLLLTQAINMQFDEN